MDYKTLLVTQWPNNLSREVNLIISNSCQIDPSILGGLVVEFGQKVFDMSIKTRAKQMERFLREPINLGTI